MSDGGHAERPVSNARREVSEVVALASVEARQIFKIQSGRAG
jgi:hypothetical protein